MYLSLLNCQSMWVLNRAVDSCLVSYQPRFISLMIKYKYIETYRQTNSRKRPIDAGIVPLNSLSPNSLRDVNTAVH